VLAGLPHGFEIACYPTGFDSLFQKNCLGPRATFLHVNQDPGDAMAGRQTFTRVVLAHSIRNVLG